MSSGDLSDALAALTILVDGGAVQYQRGSTDSLTVETGAPHASSYSLDDERAFEFGDGADDDDDGTAQRAAGVDIFSERHIFDIRSAQLIQNLKECLTDLAIRSDAQTRTTSNRPRRASAIIWSSPGRLAFTPLILSQYSCTIS